MMTVKTFTAPVADAVTLEETLLHLRVDQSADDELIKRLMVAARDYVQRITGRTLITTVWDLFADGWPRLDRLILPYAAPLSGVTHVKYTDSAEAEATFAAANYVVQTETEPGAVVLGYTKSWPTATLSPSAPVTVRYTAGYGAAAANVPEALRSAMLLLIAHWYETRTEVAMGVVVPRLVPRAAGDLMESYKVGNYGGAIWQQ